MAKPKQVNRKFNSSARLSLERRLRTDLVDPREVIRLGEIATNAPVYETTPEEVRLKQLATAYKSAGGILETVPGIGEAANLKLAEQARIYLVAYVPTNIRNLNSYCSN